MDTNKVIDINKLIKPVARITKLPVVTLVNTPVIQPIQSKEPYPVKQDNKPVYKR